MWVLVLLVAVQGALAAQEALSGKDLFAAHCAACHGRQGEGGRGVSLTNLTRARDDDALFRVIQKGIPGTEMPAAPVSDGEVRALVVFVRSLERCRGRGAGSAAGNSAGERVYLKSGCVACHTVGVEGGVMGPDLSRIGAQRDRDYLRRALLEPDADIPESFGQYRWYTVIPDNFLLVRATTRDGREIRGARVNEDSFSIQVRDVSGKIYSFWKEDLRELHKDWGKSAMPSYRGKLTDAELDDLVTYLTSLRGAK